MLLRDNVYDALRHAILTCDLQPGQELRELDLAARYAVSRSPVRDALLRLEGEHLVTVLPRQGYRVNSVSEQDARDIFGLRLVIEPACAAAAAASSDAAAVKALDRFRAHDATPDKEDGFVAYNRAFHAALAGMSGNARMAAVARDLVEQSDRLVRTSVRTMLDQDTTRLVAEHAAIIEAIQTGNAKAAEDLSRQHVADAQARVLTALRQRPAATQRKLKP
jgi:DNA-binding GntR family transcriptional regulator